MNKKEGAVEGGVAGAEGGLGVEAAAAVEAAARWVGEKCSASVKTVWCFTGATPCDQLTLMMSVCLCAVSL
jgi:hypothetical protein